MHLFNALHYREYDIIEFLKDTKKYGNTPFLWLARKNADSGRLVIAEETVTALLDMKGLINDSGLPYAYELLGNIKLALNKIREATLAYDLAIKAGNKNAYANLAFVSIVSGDHQAVIKLIPELMKRKDKNTNALEMLIGFSLITDDLKLFRESIKGVEESSLAANQKIFANVLAWLLKTGDPADSLMADRLQKAYPKQLASTINLLRMSGKANNATLVDRLQKTLDTIKEEQKSSSQNIP